jgi:hypothetical protein
MTKLPLVNLKVTLESSKKVDLTLTSKAIVNCNKRQNDQYTV